MSFFRHAIHSEGSAINYTSPEHTCFMTLKCLTISWDTAPTTSEDITVALDSELGDDWDTELYVVDPVDEGLTAVLLSDINLPMFVGDAVTVTYANSDSRRMGIQVLMTDREV